MELIRKSSQYRRPMLVKACCLCLGIGALLTATATRAEQTGIHVTGAGEVVIVPDLARVSLEARREGTDAAALKSELDAITAQVLDLARDLGVDARDVTAAAVSVYPRYRNRDGESVVDGIVASRAIEVTLRDLDRVGELINGALARGANGVNGVALDASNRPALEKQALDLAIDDAGRQARQIASRFGVALGQLIDAGGAAPQRPVPMMMDAMVAAAPAADRHFEPGEMTIRREIPATFAIDVPVSSD